MLKTLIDTFSNLDSDNQKIIIDHGSKLLYPVKIYLMIVILLLLVTSTSNYYIYKSNLNILNAINKYTLNLNS